MAAEKAADLLLGPVVDITISKVIEQLNLAVGFKLKLRSFRKKLDMVWGVLQDSEQRNLTSRPDLKPWLKELWSLAEEADNVMDEIAYEDLQWKVAAQKHMLKKVSYFFTPSSNPPVFCIKMANKIKELNAGLDSLNKAANDFGLQYRLANFPEHRENQQMPTFLVGDSSEVIGRDGDVQKIVQLLIGFGIQQRLCVVSIVGMAGIGKTTLAKLVCNNDQIRGHFFKIMWVCVSDNFDVKRILEQMLESLNKGSCGNITNLTVVAQLIREKLEEENYLLVLDDVWNEDWRKWDGLRHCLSEISTKIGSRVLVTSRCQNVASVVGTLPEHVHCLKQLKDDDCWSIIGHRVFGNSPIPLELEELETIGRENAKNCKGVPLVASVIGGLLCNKTNKAAWRDVWGSIKEADGVFSVLQMSFNHLPKPALKQCFAFCSIFPKDFVMRKEMLIQLWMALGFLSCERQMEMEATGEKYFNVLLSYSLFQDAKKYSYGRVVTCKMHDLIHDLAQSVSKSQTVILGNGSRGEITADTRHLNLISDEGMVAAKIGDAMQQLHTLFSKIDVFHNMPANFKKVRVLSFCGANIDKLPALLRKLKHLRYLDVSRTKIKELPEFITKLYQLQTLRFMDCHCIERPLEGIGNLVNLRHIYFNSEKLMPAGVGTLTCLQTLQLFVVGQQKGHLIEELGGLSQLRGKLAITNLKMVRNREEAERAGLLQKFAIQELELHFGKKAKKRLEFPWETQENLECRSKECRSEERRKHDEDVLEGLQPHSKLKSLEITNYCGEKCPSWMLEGPGNLGESTYLINLESLRFDGCHKLKSLPMFSGIGKSLSTLTCLTEVTISSCGSLELVPSLDGLLSLQKIHINNCFKLKSIGGSLSASMCLKTLRIWRCDSLEFIPSLDGLSSLQEIHIENCFKLKSIGGSLSASTCLKKLRIWICNSLEFIPSLDGLSSLQEIHMGYSEKLKSIGESLSASTCLKTLNILGCGSLEFIPSLDGLPSLQELYVRFCRKLKSIGESLSASMCLKKLEIRNCGSLEFVPSLHGLSSLQSLIIRTCDKLTSLPSGLASCTALEELAIEECHNLISIQEDLRDLCSLVQLGISKCGKLRNILGVGEILGYPLARLRMLRFGGFSAEHEELEEYPIQFEELGLVRWEKLKQLPHQIQRLNALRKLTIKDFDGLEALPDWLGNLSSLQLLVIANCKSLKHVEAIRCLSNLDSLFIWGCPELSGSCARGGSEWNNISHIPRMYLDGRQIRFGEPYIEQTTDDDQQQTN